MGKDLKFEQERPLSEAEKKRADAFALTEKGLKEQGYERKDLTISINKANSVGPLLTLPFVGILVLVFTLINGTQPWKDLISDQSVKFSILLIVAGLSVFVLAIVHEGIHGLSWGLGAENGMKDIEYGFIKEKITPYCYCRSPLTKGRYIFGSMMPMTILGLGFCIPGIIFGSVILMIIGMLQVLGGSGDILITAMLLLHKTKGKETVLLDHPTECGLVVFEKKK